MKLTAQLVHNDKIQRDRAVRQLKRYLVSGKGSDLIKHEPIESSKLWKALYYCFFNSDKAHVQQELADQMAELIFCFKGKVEAAVNWIRAFWETVDREWDVMDKHRIDKYYAMMRKVIRAMFSFSIANNCCMEIMRVLKETCLRPNTKHRGVALHVIDVFLPELIAAVDNKKISFIKVKELFTPLTNLLENPESELVLVDRVLESGFAALFQEIAVDEEEARKEMHQQLERGEEEDLPEQPALIQVVRQNSKGMAEMFREISSRAGKTINRQRRNDLNDLVTIYSQVEAS
jgi:hypothetical protein